MPAQRTGEREGNLGVERQATLRDRCPESNRVLADHIAGIEQQIRAVEQNLALLRQSPFERA